MTKLLADSLAGNAVTVMIATLRQGEFSESEAVLKLLQVCFRLGVWFAVLVLLGVCTLL